MHFLMFHAVFMPFTLRSHWLQVIFQIDLRPCFGLVLEILGSMSISEQLRTYPFPNPLLTLTYYQLTVVGLGEGRCAVAKIPTVHQILNRKALQSVPFLTPLVNIWSIRASWYSFFKRKNFISHPASLVCLPHN